MLSLQQLLLVLSLGQQLGNCVSRSSYSLLSLNNQEDVLLNVADRSSAQNVSDHSNNSGKGHSGVVTAANLML